MISHPAQSGSEGACGGADLDQAIAVLRGRIDEEFRIAERLDSKTRQAFAFAAGFFAVIQTVAFGSFASSGVTTEERAVLLILVVAAGGFVARIATRALAAEELQAEIDASPEAIAKWANEAGSDPEYVRVRLVGKLSKVARSRADNNETRSERYDDVVAASRLAMIVIGVELIWAIVARL